MTLQYKKCQAFLRRLPTIFHYLQTFHQGIYCQLSYLLTVQIKCRPVTRNETSSERKYLYSVLFITVHAIYIFVNCNCFLRYRSEELEACKLAILLLIAFRRSISSKTRSVIVALLRLGEYISDENKVEFAATDPILELAGPASNGRLGKLALTWGEPPLLEADGGKSGIN